MRREIFLLILLFLAVPPGWPQSAESGKSGTPPAQDSRYANMPDEAVPFRRFTKPYQEWFIQPNTLEYNGAAQDHPDGDLNQLKEIAIGFLGPLENNPESVFGVTMLHGAQLAAEEANARGGYHGKPYALKVHNDSALWGASSVEIVKMLFDENCWAMLGSIDGQSTHVALRVTLKLELPIMDTGTTDPTVTETRIPWLMHDFIDDRQQGYALAEYILKQLKLKRIGVLRTNSRYARIGVVKFSDEARRMGRQPVLAVKFDRGDRDFSKQLRMMRDARIEGLVIWGEAPEAGLILKQMHAMDMNQPVFGSSRTAYPELLKNAGAAADGFVSACPLDPSRKDAEWIAFRDQYRWRFGEEPDAYASYAYDGMHILIGAIEKAGLNRGRIMNVLRDYQLKTYDGVSGRAYFDHTLNNIGGVTLAKVEKGRFVYWKAPSTRPEQTAVARSH